MNVLFVTPSEVSSGESITALHMAQWIRTKGHKAHFLASTFTAAFIRNELPNAVTELGQEMYSNQRTWEAILHEFNPTHIVFADYPLLTFTSGTTPLRDLSWESRLDACAAEIFTLDHLGYAQRPRLVFFGPPHGTLGLERIPAIPSRAQVLLPCPLHDPDNPSLQGLPFRYWNSPAEPPLANPGETRAPFVRSAEELLIVHCVSGWASRAAELLRNPYYMFLPRLLSYYLRDFPWPITVLSVNNGSLLPEIRDSRMRIANTGPMEPAQYERLLLASDLVITENRVSVSLAKAIILRKPCAVLRNSHTIGDVLGFEDPSVRAIAQEMERHTLGSVFPFEVFPIWSRSDLEDLGIFDGSSLQGAFAELELFEGSRTAQQLHNLLINCRSGEIMRTAQCSYLERVKSLPSPAQVLLRLTRE